MIHGPDSAASAAPQLGIAGIGVQLVDVARFEAALARYGDRMRRRLFTPEERAYAAQRALDSHSLAVRFAAKLAGRRALGLAAPRWQELEVVRERGQAPTLRLHGRAAERAEGFGVDRIALTLTHDEAFCIGQVILEGANPRAAALAGGPTPGRGEPREERA